MLYQEIYPDDFEALISNEYKSSQKFNKTLICLGYKEDLNAIYSFYCARYENISMDEFLNLNYFDLVIKLGSIPENEPLYKIIKSRSINLAKIKDKEERKYWRELKRVNAIPDIYLSNVELDNNLKETFKHNKGGIVGGKRI